MRTLADLPDVLYHLAHANSVQGGGMLFSEGAVRPLLTLEEFLDHRKAAQEALTSQVRRRRVGRNRVRETANSAEGVRQLKRQWGVPLRPTTRPVDEWGKK